MTSQGITRLHSLLRAVHRRGQALGVLLGLMVFIIWLILLFLAGLAVDWTIHLPSVIRFVLLPVLVGYPLFKAWQIGWKSLCSFKPEHAALRAEKHYGKLESLLVSGVQLMSSPAPGTSVAMSNLTVKKADETAGGLRSAKVVSFESLKIPAVRALLLSAVILLISVLNSQLLAVGLTRLFTPWQWAQYPTRTIIVLTSGEIVVKEGQPVEIGAIISGEIPANARLALRTGKGRPNKRTIDVVDGICKYRISSAFRSFDYYISAGDARSKWQKVKVVSSPRVVRTEIRLVFPAYMNRAPETMEAMTLTVPEGVTMEWNLKLDRAVSAAKFNIEGRDPIPLEVSADGLTVTHKMTAGASGAYSFSWVEKEHGFGFNTPKNYLQVAPDQAPQIELVSPSRSIFATIGRKLVLGYRARDDHGLGESRIMYRRGNADERSVPFKARLSEGREVQNIDWDYRKVLKDLDIGETVTFAIEVTDMYPPPGGPHRARTESRRVSFLSKEDYLAKVKEQKERLLSQLRAVYRQERAAHEVIRRLDPKSDSFEQTCFLESARQDILVERITLLGKGIADLIDDLKANNIKDKAEFESLNKLRSSLDDIATKRIAAGASQLRDMGPNRNSTVDDVARTASAINVAARELSSLVLQLGVHEAMEVFAMELHVIAESQSALRVETVDSARAASELAERQRKLAQWSARLLAELGANPDYSKAPLLVVRLARMIKDMRAAGVAVAMNDVAGLLDKGKLMDAAEIQGKIVSNLFQLECNIRVGSEYEALLKARDLCSGGINELSEIMSDNSGFTPAQVRHKLRVLQRDLRLLILPTIPAPVNDLLDEKPSQVPPVDELVAMLQSLLGTAADLIDGGKVNLADTGIKQVADTLKALDGIVRTRLYEITEVARCAGYAGSSAERVTLVRDLLTSQMRLTEKTEDAQYDKTSGAYLAPSQQHLGGQVLEMCARIERKNRGSSSSRAVKPMLAMLKRASEAMVKASPFLQEEKLDDAIAEQDHALDALQAGMAFANNEASGWAGLANLVMTAEGISMPAKFMRDIVAEQRDLIAATKTSTSESRRDLILIQTNLVLAVLDVSMLVQSTGSGLDFEQAMLFAGSDMGLSAQKLKAGDVPGAVRAQQQATESVLDLSRQLDASEAQIFYFGVVMEFLQGMHTDGVVLLDGISQLNEALEAGGEKGAKAQLRTLRALLEDAERFSSRLMLATGRPDYNKVAESLKEAEKELVAGHAGACLDQSVSAEDALKESMTELRELMSHVAVIPAITPIEAPPEYNVMLEMVTLLLDQKELARAVYFAKKKDLPTMVQREGELAASASDLVESTLNHALMIEARKLMTEASALLGKSEGPEAFTKLYQAETKLRQCILEYALYYVEPPRSHGGKRKKRGKIGPSPTMFKMALINKRPFEKEWGGVDGEDPGAGRTEWEVLGRRDRAALNENFVRELPLEYREFLKDYYERLAR